MPRKYVDNAYNRRVGRVGSPVGSAVISKNTFGGINTKTYVDNAYNRQHGRVGMPHGSAVISKYSDEPIRWTYLDTDRKDRPTSPQGISIQSHSTSKYTDYESRRSGDEIHIGRDFEIGEHHTQYQSRNETEVYNRGDRFGCTNNASKPSGKSSTSSDSVERGIGAAVEGELNQRKSDIGVTGLFQSDLQGGELYQILMCPICHTDVECASITPCGHHFCTHCILQLLERKPSCPICKRSLKEGDLIQDRDFDRIVGHFGSRPVTTTNEYRSNRNKEIEQYKDEIKQLKTQLQDVKGELTKTKTEVSCLQETVLKLQVFETKCIEQDRQLQVFQENILPEKEKTISELRTGVAQTSEQYKDEIEQLKTQLQDVKEKEAEVTQKVHDLQEELQNNEQRGQQLNSELTKTKTEVSCLQETVLKLQVYETKCIEQDRQLQVFQENILPEKEKTISELRTGVAQTSEQYKDEIEQLKTQLQDVKEKEAKVTQKVHDLQEELQNNEQRGQQLNSELTKTKTEVSCLQQTVLKLQMYETKCIEQDRQLQVFQENILPEKEKTISELRTCVAQTSDALNAKENEIGCLNDQIQHLQQYVQLCCNLNDKLKDYRENIVPEKDNTISELRSHAETLYGEVASMKRIPITVRELEALPDSNLGRAIQQLQHFYDRDYRSRYDLTDKKTALLQARVECVANELCKEQEIGDQLALVITTYTSMVQENSNLHRSLRAKQDEVQNLKTELRQTKLTKRNTEQRLRYMTVE